MKPLSEFNPEENQIKYIFTDVDDTLTENGKLSAEVYSVLWRLSRAGYRVIPVTGGSAGLGYTMFRQWPVDAVIAESGAIAFFYKENQLQTLVHPSIVKENIKDKIESTLNTIKKEFPQAKLAKDQFTRIYDLAIDYNEDNKLGYDTAVKIKNLCNKIGAEAQISSIHVNIWFGNYCKKKMVEHFSKECLGLSEEQLKKEAVYCGDSPNDEPMFELIPLSFAVANILSFEKDIKTKPAFYAPSECGRGFIEIAEKFL